MCKTVTRKPDRIGKPDHDGVPGVHQRTGAEQGIAQAGGLRLNDVTNVGAGDAPSVVFEDVGFAGGDYKAKLVDSG